MSEAKGDLIVPKKGKTRDKIVGTVQRIKAQIIENRNIGKGKPISVEALEKEKTELLAQSRPEASIWDRLIPQDARKRLANQLSQLPADIVHEAGKIVALARDGREKNTGAVNYKDWEKDGTSPDTPKPLDQLIVEGRMLANTMMVLLEGIRYDQLRIELREIYQGYANAIAYYNREGDRRRERGETEPYREVEALTREQQFIATRLKLARMFRLFVEHTGSEQGSFNKFTEAVGNEEINWGMDDIAVMFGHEEIRREFDSLVKGSVQRRARIGTPNEVFDARISDEITSDMGDRGLMDSRVWAKRMAWQLYVITNTYSQLDDPNLGSSHHIRAAKKLIAPYQALWSDRSLGGTENWQEYQIINRPARIAEILNDRGELVREEGIGADGQRKNHADYLGMPSFFLALGNSGENGINRNWWLSQDENTLTLVRQRHQQEGIYKRDEKGEVIRVNGRPQIIEYPIDANDLLLVDWNRVTGRNTQGALPGEGEFMTWLDYCKKAEWSRDYIMQILPSLAEPEIFETLVEISRDVGKVVEKKPLYQRYVPPDRRRAEIEWLKSEAFIRMIDRIELGSGRTAQLRDQMNALAAKGGDAERNEIIYGRSMSDAELQAFPLGYREIARILTTIYNNEQPVDFTFVGVKGRENIPYANIPQFTEVGGVRISRKNEACQGGLVRGIFRRVAGDQAVSLVDVLNFAGEVYGYQPERQVRDLATREMRGETFFEWLVTVGDDNTLPERRWGVEERDAEWFRINETVINNPRDIRSRNLRILLERFGFHYTFGTVQKALYEDVVQNAIGYFQTPPELLYRKHTQFELIYRAALLNLHDLTPDEVLKGDRFLELVAGGIIGGLTRQQYIALENRATHLFPMWLYPDDRRKIWLMAMFMTDEFSDRFFKMHGSTPPDEETGDYPFPWVKISANREDFAALFDLAMKMNTTGEGYMRAPDIQPDRESLGASENAVRTHRFLRKYVFGIFDKKLKPGGKSASESVSERVAGFIPGGGSVYEIANSLKILPFPLTGMELITFPIGYTVAEVILSNVAGGVAGFGITPFAITLPALGPIPAVPVTLLALNAAGLLGGAITRIGINKIGHAAAGANFWRKVPGLNQIFPVSASHLDWANDMATRVFKNMGM